MLTYSKYPCSDCRLSSYLENIVGPIGDVTVMNVEVWYFELWQARLGGVGQSEIVDVFMVEYSRYTSCY